MPRREYYRIRPLEESDIEQVLKWRNSEHVRANMYTDHIINIDEHRRWFEKISLDESCCYKIFEFQDHPVGLVSATKIDKHNNKCFWAFYLGEKNLPNGSGAVMELLFLDYLFEYLNIRKICCEVFTFNLSTIKLHKKFGFVEEGYFTKHVYKNDKYEDVMSLALFKDKWLEIKQKMEILCFKKK